MRKQMRRKPRDVGMRQAADTEHLSADELFVEEDAPWLSFGSEMEIAGVTAAEAYAMYSHLPNHPRWSSLLTEVREDSAGAGLSEWSLNVLGMRLAWRARVTEEVAPKRIAWESVDGVRNRGLATFANASSASEQPACKVRMQLSFQTPAPVQRVLSSRRLTTLAEYVLKKDLIRFADVLTQGGDHAAFEAEAEETDAYEDDVPVTNSTHADGPGSCSVQLWSTGAIDVQLQGFGTAGNTQNMLDDLAEGMKELGGSTSSADFRALIDMTRGVGCSPLAVPVISRFLRGSGRLVRKTAVVGPIPLIRLAQAIAMMARHKGVAFFGTREEAAEWLNLPDDREDNDNPNS